jgi:HD-GYP domain-containing protein (c-di-GMP phosphodiesterase class II)
MTTTQIPDCEVKTTSPTAGYLPVQLAMLQRLNQATVDLFVQYERNSTPVLYHRAGCPLEAGITDKLRDSGIESIYVRGDDFQFFGAHLLEVVDSLADRSMVSAGERFAALQLAMAVEIEHAARLIDCGPYISVANKVGRELTSLLTQSNALPNDLFRLARHDFNTFTHVTNVASYGVLLAERLQLCSENELEQIAKAAILHDIGKRFIPAKILNKPAKLDPEERAIIETHPQRGYEELCARGDLTVDQLMIVYQHHERVDGTGYPVGLEGDEIHPWARMLAVVDVFDAMTGVRPYRRAATAAEAMDYICKSAGTHFDPEMVKCWNSMMAKK